MCNLSTDVLAPCALMARVVKCDNFLLNTKIRSSPAYSQKKISMMCLHFYANKHKPLHSDSKQSRQRAAMVLWKATLHRIEQT
jgi:hypothetical protein